EDWYTESTFWTKAIQTSPQSFKTHVAYAMAINIPAEEATVDRSIRENDVALAILKPLPYALRPSAPYINGGMYFREKGLLVKKKFTDAAEGEKAARPWFEKSLVPLLEAKGIEEA